MIEIIKLIGSILSIIVSASAVLGMLIKPIRTKLFNAIKTHSNTEGTSKELKAINKSIEELQKTINDLHSHDKEKQDERACIIEALQCIVRKDILDIFDDYSDVGEIPAHRCEVFTKLYFVYRALGGNSFVQKLYEQVSEEWTIIPNR